jgi:DNA repair protein SbcC/Rad50
MRPRRLTVEGLTCFRDKHDLDLRELEIFAITGPTGAGKSSLLDAISFALYGAVPRVKKDQRTELISASRDRASVVLDFDLGGARYRIARTLRRSGANSARLERHDGKDFSINLADQVRAADAKIEELLGMTVEAFQQAVMLPQGEFACFLEADPRERRKTLQSLLRLDVYERMRERANQIASRMRGSVDSTKKLLEEEYLGIDAEALAALQEQYTRVEVELEAKRGQREDAQQALLALQERFEKTSELLRCEGKAEALRKRDFEVGRQRAQLAAARRAQPLSSLLDEVRLAREEVSRAAEKQARIEARGSSRRVAFQMAERELTAAREAASGIAALRGKVAELHRVAGRLPEVKELEQTIERHRRRLPELDVQIDKLTAVLAAATAAGEAQAAALEEAKRAMLAAGFQPQLLEILEQQRARAMALGVARKSAGADRAALVEKARLLDAVERDCALLTERSLVAEDQAKQARHGLEQAQAELDKAERLDAASMLRRTLRPGDPCPVCAHAIHELSAETEAVVVADARGAVLEAKEQLATVEAAAKERRRALDRALDRRAEQQEALATLSARCSEQEISLQREDAELRLVVSSYFSPGAHEKESVEEWLSASFSSQRACRKAYEEAEKRAGEAGKLLERSENDANNARERLAERAEARQQVGEDLGGSVDRLTQVRGEIFALSSSRDPAAEAEELLQQIAALEDREQRAETSIAEAERELAGQAEAELAAKEVTAQATTTLQKREQRRDRELELAGFVDEGAMALALLEPEEIARIEASVSSFDLELHVVRERLAMLRTDLGEVRVSEGSVKEASALARQLNGEVEGKSGQRDALAQQIAEMTRRLGMAEDMRRRLADEGRELEIHGQLATDLKSDKFQAYLLQGVFAELVQGASARLRTLSGDRYSLLFKDDDIYVVDNDNAGDVRLIETLSGGETFLTSLALALELSEQVQRAAGAVRLDSLFIDEGFGTLDPDTLRTVSAAIQDLRVGGRMVGVITHIPELRDEFEQQIIVTKHLGYSTATVRSAAT